MKATILSIMLFFLVGTVTSFAQKTKTEKIKVSGNCGLCKTRIQNTAMSVDGVTAANWNQETKVLQVSFDPAKTSNDKIQLAIAKAGHDTENHKAPAEAYNKLPKCCQYR